MATVPDLRQTGETPKRRNGDGAIDLSPYQNILLYYERLQQAYGWTMWEIDNHEIAYLLDQLVVVALMDESKSQKYIDDVM